MVDARSELPQQALLNHRLRHARNLVIYLAGGNEPYELHDAMERLSHAGILDAGFD
jgi:hypothetical protein